MAGGGGTGPRPAPRPVRSYVASAVELHLSARIDGGDAPSREALDRFLSGGSGGPVPGGDGGSAPGRLFVWVPRPGGGGGGSDGEEEAWDAALASTDAPDGRNLGSVAFVDASPGAGAGAPRQIQCVVLSPRVYPDGLGGDAGEDGGAGEDAAGEDAAGASSPDPGSATYLALQLYARHCFVPAVRAVGALPAGDAVPPPASDGAAPPPPPRGGSGPTAAPGGLEDRLRELDVALGQCRRGALGRIPGVRLAVHPDVAAAAGGLDGGRVDVDGSGLGDRADDDRFLNEVQAGVGRWISQIRKVRDSLGAGWEVGPLRVDG